DRAGGDLADLAQHLEEVAAGLPDQRRVGGDAVDESECGKFADLGDLGRINEEFHVFRLSLEHRRSAGGAPEPLWFRAILSQGVARWNTSPAPLLPNSSPKGRRLPSSPTAGWIGSSTMR